MTESQQQPDCLFCKIVAGTIPCTSVYESETFLAFLDIGPVNKGHTLLIPKQHMTTLFDAPTQIGVELIDAMQRIGKAVMQATGATGLNIYQNNFPAAGQEVAHLHWHLIPRFADDGLKSWTQQKYADLDEMNRLATSIRNAL